MADHSRHLGLWGHYTAFGQDDTASNDVDCCFPSERAALISFPCEPCFHLGLHVSAVPEVPRMHWDSILIETGETSFPPMPFRSAGWSTGHR